MTDVRAATGGLASVAFTCAALACGAAAAVPRALAAQTTVSGMVQDSIAHHPLAGATVQLVPQGTSAGAPRGIDADATGAFRFPGVAPGRYLLGFVHERLDSLGIQPPVRTIEVGPGAAEVRVDLAVPSARTIAAAICGVRHDSTGVLLGRVLDAETGDAVTAGSVLVRWGELRIDARGVHRETPSVRAALNEEGRYAACGVPIGMTVLVQASAGPTARPTAASGAIEVRMDSTGPLVHRDLFVSMPNGEVAATSGRRGTARLSGRVRRPDGSALAGARVVVRGTGAVDSVAITDTTGAFRLDALPAGTYAVEAIAIGFTPARDAVDLRPEQAATVDLAVGARVATLQSVNVYAAHTRAGTAFAERARHASGFARFVTAADIARRVPLTIADALAMTPGRACLEFEHDGPPTDPGARRVRARGLSRRDTHPEWRDRDRRRREPHRGRRHRGVSGRELGAGAVRAPARSRRLRGDPDLDEGRGAVTGRGGAHGGRARRPAAPCSPTRPVGNPRPHRRSCKSE